MNIFKKYIFKYMSLENIFKLHFWNAFTSIFKNIFLNAFFLDVQKYLENIF